MNRNELNHRLPLVVESIVKSVVDEPRTQHLNRVQLPSRDVIIECIKMLRQLMFPGYFAKQGSQALTVENIPFRIGELVLELSDLLYEQVRCCLRYREKIAGANGDAANDGNGAGNGTSASASALCAACDAHAAEIVSTFLDRIPAVRAMLAEDVQAAFDGDPAAQNTDETI